MDEKGLRDAIQIYFDATNESSAEIMSEVFHDSAHLYGHEPDGALLDWDKSFFMGIMRSTKEASQGKEFPIVNDLLSIDFTSEKTAIVRLKVNVLDLIYTDILSFICLDGRWWIIAKLATLTPA
jgi:hypothetical protein